MAEVTRTTKEEILNAFKERIEDKLPKLQDGAIFFSADPNPLKGPPVVARRWRRNSISSSGYIWERPWTRRTRWKRP